MEPPSCDEQQLDDLINVAPITQHHLDDPISNYSFKKPSSSSSSEEEEPENTKKHRFNPEGEEEADWSVEERPSGLKTLAALLVVLCIVAAIVAVIGYTTWTNSRDNAKTPRKPLWTEQHNTLSEPFNPAAFRAFAADLERELSPYLLEAPNYYPCLCMHHLQSVSFPSFSLDSYALQLNGKLNGYRSYQVCGVTTTAKEVLLLVNPRLQGRGNETDAYTERSVSCPAGSVQRRHRFRTIFLEWLDVSSSTQTMWARFEGRVAACLQLALDEMLQGEKHC